METPYRAGFNRGSADALSKRPYDKSVPEEHAGGAKSRAQYRRGYKKGFKASHATTGADGLDVDLSKSPGYQEPKPTPFLISKTAFAIAKAQPTTSVSKLSASVKPAGTLAGPLGGGGAPAAAPPPETKEAPPAAPPPTEAKVEDTTYYTPPLAPPKTMALVGPTPTSPVQPSPPLTQTEEPWLLKNWPWLLVGGALLAGGGYAYFQYSRRT